MKYLLKRAARIIPDRLYLELKYRSRMGKKLNLENPRTYSEKLQWLKLYYHNPVMTKLVDKYEVKSWVAERIGEEHIIPTLGVWDSFEEINFRDLPEQFVLKCTHDCGSCVVIPDKSKMNRTSVETKLKQHLNYNYYWHSREWPYKYVKPRILAEKFMVDESGYELKDYKWFCFGGKPKFLFIATDRGVPGKETKFDFYDENFAHLDLKNGHENAGRELPCPPGFETMKEFAAVLSEGFPEVRVDFYDVNGAVYFGEMTFFHWGGMMPFDPESWDSIFGDLVILPEKQNL